MTKGKNKRNEIKKKILQKLAKKPNHMYPFYAVGRGKAIASRSVIYRVKDDLLKKGLIKLVKKEKRGGPDKKVYGLTFLGVLISYRNNTLTAKHIHSIVETFKDDVTFFEEWEYFKKNGVGELAEKHLMYTLQACCIKNQIGELKLYDKKKVVKDISQTFLIFGLMENYFFDFSIKIDEDYFCNLHRLEEVFDKNKKLFIYRTWLKKMQLSTIHINRNIEDEYYEDQDMENYPDSSEQLQRLHDMLLWKIDEKKRDENIYNIITDAILQEDYFWAAFLLCELYTNYLFFSFTEFDTSIRGCISFLAGEAKRKTISKKRLEDLSLEVFAAFYFFKIQTTKMQGKRWYQLIPDEKKEKIDDNYEKARSEALDFTKKQLCQIKNKIKKEEISFNNVSKLFIQQKIEKVKISQFGED